MNKLLDRVELLQKLDTHILMQEEGQIQEIAKKFGISRRRIYAYFQIMKQLGAPVVYNFEKHRLEYKTKFRLRVRINTAPKVVPPTLLYKKIKDVTLKKVMLFNQIDEHICNKDTGGTKEFYKKLKMRDHRVCGNTLYEFKKMGADFYFDRTNKTYRYAKKKRFNIIIEVVPFKMPSN